MTRIDHERWLLKLIDNRKISLLKESTSPVADGLIPDKADPDGSLEFPGAQKIDADKLSYLLTCLMKARYDPNLIKLEFDTEGNLVTQRSSPSEPSKDDINEMRLYCMIFINTIIAEKKDLNGRELSEWITYWYYRHRKKFGDPDSAWEYFMSCSNVLLRNILVELKQNGGAR